MHKAKQEEDLQVNWTNGKRLTGLDFADDITLLAENGEDIQRLRSRLEEVASKVGLRIRNEKTKVTYVGATNSTTTIKVGTQPIKEVDHFTYLGSLIASDGNVDSDIYNRISKTAAVFRRMNNTGRASAICAQLKLRLYNSVALPTALYASETWKSTVKMDKKIHVFHQRCLRRVMKITYRD